MNQSLKALLNHLADDNLIVGHRNSEWTGFGPIMEEDIAFSSMAQDKIGHALALYDLLHKFASYPDPDTYAFTRAEKDWLCCQYVCMPNQGYEYALIRHFFYNHAEYIRFQNMASCNFEPLAIIAQKFKGEIKYHIMHANTWMKQLAFATDESKMRLQKAINESYEYALSLFEPHYNQNEIAEYELKNEIEIQALWIEKISTTLEQWNLGLPNMPNASLYYGGRKGQHNEHLQPLLSEMSEVINSETKGTEW